MTGKEWRPVVGAERTHEVSDLGRVRSLPRVVVMSNGRRRPVKGAVLAPWSSEDAPYPVLSLSRYGRHQRARVHALVAEAFIGPRPAGQEVRHLDGDPGNCRADNLAYGTPVENRADMTRHGRDHQRAKTTCNLGHALHAPNLVASHAKLGRRACLACRRARAAGQKAARRGAPFDLQVVADRRFAEIMETA